MLIISKRDVIHTFERQAHTDTPTPQKHLKQFCVIIDIIVCTCDIFVINVADFSGKVEGSITTQAAPKDSTGYGVRRRGAASKFLENRGFGWLLEEDDADEEEDQRPLL